jgi:hypothetical protein
MSQTARVLARPLYADTASATSRSAVLIELSAYPSTDARYRLFKGSSQYQCWDTLNKQFVTSTSYASGPPAPGLLTSTSAFWIPYLRGNNNSTIATYRDRLGPEYKENFRDVVLPAASGIANPFILTGTLLPGDDFPLTAKYIILLFRGADLISASHSDTVTGSFSAVCPVSITIDKLEVRTILNDLALQKVGEWSSTSELGDLRLGTVTGIERTASGTEKDLTNVFPVPATDFITVKTQGEPERVDVIDLSGNIVASYRNPEGTTFEINISAIPSGIYFVRMSMSGQIITKTIIKL